PKCSGTRSRTAVRWFATATPATSRRWPPSSRANSLSTAFRKLFFGLLWIGTAHARLCFGSAPRMRGGHAPHGSACPGPAGGSGRAADSSRHAHERVVPPLVADGGFLHVPRQNSRLLREDEQPLRDALQNLVRVAARQISAADRLAEQRIAAEQQPRL